MLLPQISCGQSISSITDINSHTLQLDDLNDDVVLGIFEELDFEELLDLADVNIQFRDLITQHYIIPKCHLNEQVVQIIPYAQCVHKFVFNEDFR